MTMPRTLAELSAAVDGSPYARRFSRDMRWQLCSACPVIPCNPKALACRCRRMVCKRQSEYVARRTYRTPLTPEQRERKNARNREYYAESADVVKAKERARYRRKREQQLGIGASQA